MLDLILELSGVIGERPSSSKTIKKLESSEPKPIILDINFVSKNWDATISLKKSKSEFEENAFKENSDIITWFPFSTSSHL